jgi:two-component system chemotaxis response regulator CheB
MTEPARRIRVLVADDSPAVVDMLSLLLSEDAAIEVVGRATDGRRAVELARELRPDVITMDVLMPVLDGLEATAAIMADAPSRVLIVSSVDERQLDLSFRAMAVGALEVIRKPTPKEAADIRAWGARVAEAVRLMAEVPVVTRAGRRRGRASVAPECPRVDAIGIVASTGGPPVLASLLASLPHELPAPILVAQHLASGFTDGFARWLAQTTALTVAIAAPHALAQPGCVYLPPDSHHLEVTPDGLFAIARGEGDLIPSGDRLLRSLAGAYGARACGVVLTGMGADGADGLLALRRAGGLTLAQDETTCTVFGMPRVARDNGAARHMLPPDLIASLIRDRCRPAAAAGALTGERNST